MTAQTRRGGVWPPRHLGPIGPTAGSETRRLRAVSAGSLCWGYEHMFRFILTSLTVHVMNGQHFRFDVLDGSCDEQSTVSFTTEEAVRAP